MRGKNSSFILILFVGILVLTSFSVSSLNVNNTNISKTEGSDFYFVHMTDTHIMHESFGNLYNKYSKDRFLKVLDEINSFENKPAFLVITGDLVEWGSGASGALNYETLLSCLFENDEQFYIDSEFSIPVYFTPGNHDYYFNWNLDNYFNYINEDRRYTITYEDMTLFFMDSGPHYMMEPKHWLDVFARGLDDEDIAWLEEEFNSCNSEHKIVLMHHPAINDRKDDGGTYDVLLNNRETFIELCEQNDVDLVLAGHTHSSRVFDSDENKYSDYPINTAQYPTLFVQSKANKVDSANNPNCNYRNISVIDGEIWLEENENVDFKSKSHGIKFPLKLVNIKLVSIILKMYFHMQGE